MTFTHIRRPPFYLRTRPGNLLYRFIDSPGYTSWSITISFFQGVSALLFIRQTVETPVYLFLSFWNLSISLFRHSLWKSHNHSNIFTDLWMRPLIKVRSLESKWIVLIIFNFIKVFIFFPYILKVKCWSYNARHLHNWLSFKSQRHVNLFKKTLASQTKKTESRVYLRFLLE